MFIYLEIPTEDMANKIKAKAYLDLNDSKNYIINEMWYQNSENHTAAEFKVIVRLIETLIILYMYRFKNINIHS